MKHNLSKKVTAITLLLVLLGSSVWYMATAAPQQTTSKYEKVDVNTLTGDGEEPDEISAQSKQKYFEKEWYEYIPYNDRAVASYRINDVCRYVYYDPYDYSTAMIMDVTYDDKIGWGTQNSVSISHTFSKSYMFGKQDTNNESTSTQKADGKDVTRPPEMTNSSTEIVTKLGPDMTSSLEATIGSELSSGFAKVTAEAKTSATISTVAPTETNVEESEVCTTEGWTQIADRITTTTGSSNSTNRAWTNEESVTITKNYEAAYFNSSGAPLPWTVAYYEVKMPMRYAVQFRVDNGWATAQTGYCVLTTIQGSCRAWRDNTVTYYEHWGTGEPVADTEFWGRFFTKEKLIKAYEQKLYPQG